ncbi:MAG: hypothetical protein FWF38_05470 [Spirochaetaceae bacterium]|nr:hypothetical protein [Spirochaetaceae bacterium]
MRLHRIIIALIVICIIFITLFLIKNYGPGSYKVVLWTDNPEFISYVEMFNSKHDKLKIEPVYKKDPAKALIKTRRYPDIVVSSYLNSPQVIDNFKKINSLFRKDKIDKNSFYKELLSKGVKGGKQLVLPVSFNMPALMFRRGDVSHNISNFVLTYENVIEISKTFNENKKKGISAFSPRWNSNMLYYTAVMSNADFRASGHRSVSYNMNGIEESLKATRAFINDINGGIEKDKLFEEKHLYKPAENLINEQRIFFAYTDLRDFYATGQQKRERLNFRWLSKDNKIPVCDDIIYAGIPKSASNKKGAEIFLIWLFDYHTQENIMEAGKSKRIRSFGISSGFSSLRTVNEQVFPKHYPLLVGHIPPHNMLVFPSSLPVEWEALKASIIKKWLYREAGNTRTTSDLEAAIRDWYKFNL